MKRLFSCCSLLIIMVTSLRADITFEGVQKVPSYSIAKVRAKSADYKSYVYKVYGPDGKRVKTEKGLDGWVLFTGSPGEYRVEATAGKTDKDGNVTLEDAEYTITIGDPPPPTPPVPPGPPPAPDPFGVNKTAGGLRVLIVYESGDLSKYPAAQVNAMQNKDVRALMADKCVVGSDGKTKDWRVWDKDVDTSNETPLWQKVMKRDRKSLPWIVIGNGSAGYEGPLPADSAATIKLISKYVKN